jgi:hypothetical protein
LIYDLTETIEAARKAYPKQWATAHNGTPQSEDFIKLVVPMLSAEDVRRRDLADPKNAPHAPRIGLNGKRGNPKDLSDDAINILGEGNGHTPDGVPCQVVDIIARAGAPNAEPAWIVFTDPKDSSGAWVSPTAAPTPEPIPQPPTAPVQPYPDEPEWWGKVFTPAVIGLYKEANRPFPDHGDDSVTLDGFRHWSRTAYDIRDGLTKEAALAKRIAELRKELGLS